MKNIQIGAIPFLNAKPVFYGLESGAVHGNVVLNEGKPACLPAENVELLREGSLDLALIPSIELARSENLRLVPGIAIGSDGPVASVMLYSSKPLAEVRSIAVDERSRTSVALLHILCKEFYGIDPSFTPAEPKLEQMLEEHDAAMLFGDTALYTHSDVTEVRDLGADWRTMTGYPFTFAVIAGRPEGIEKEHIELLHDSLTVGLVNIRKIAENHPGPCMEGAADLNEKYLTENISYSFSNRELDGLKLFFIKAWEHGIIDGVPRIEFYAR